MTYRFRNMASGIHSGGLGRRDWWLHLGDVAEVEGDGVGGVLARAEEGGRRQGRVR